MEHAPSTTTPTAEALRTHAFATEQDTAALALYMMHGRMSYRSYK